MKLIKTVTAPRNCTFVYRTTWNIITVYYPPSVSTRNNSELYYANYRFSELPKGAIFDAAESFSQLLRLTQCDHHCSHYATQLKDVTIVDADGNAVDAASDTQFEFGEWPLIMPLFSCNCPVVTTYFRDFNAVFARYTQDNNLKLLGLSFAIDKTDSPRETLYYVSILFAPRTDSETITCQNQNCTGGDCLATGQICYFARNLHATTL